MGMLDGKRAVVTGVGPGLGTEMALGLAREGADVALVARSERVTPEVAAQIEAMGRRAPVVSANIVEPDDVARMSVWLGAPASDFMNGSEVVVDGGFLAV